MKSCIKYCSVVYQAQEQGSFVLLKIGIVDITVLQQNPLLCLWQQERIGLTCRFILTVVKAQAPWDHILLKYTASIGTPQTKADLNLSTSVLCGNKIRLKDERSLSNSLQMARLYAIPGEKVQIGCRVIKRYTYKPTGIMILPNQKRTMVIVIK